MLKGMMFQLVSLLVGKENKVTTLENKVATLRGFG